ncbi:MAG: polysaccharide biosynthesis tyrosine autokinase [Verrucomicrobia bacterium]|nr:polysaccharide biosynthesis tyrosine autokinase [Verrucomicrobiota bacterium]
MPDFEPQNPPVIRAGPQPEPSQLPAHGLDLRTLLHVLIEKAWVILLFMVIAVLLATGYISRAPILYSSTATLEVEQQEQKIIRIEKGYSQEGDLRSLDVLQTIAQTLKSRAMLERVIDTNNLASDPRFVGLMKEAPTRERIVLALSKMVDVRLRRGTRLIDITVVHTVPEITDRIANSLVAEFKKQNEEQHTSVSEVANQFLLQESERLKKKLADSEAALQSYREKTGAVSLDDRQNTVVAKLKELSTRVTEAKSMRIKAESDYAQLERLGTNVQDLLVLAVVAHDPKVMEIQMTINKLDSELANLRQRYKEKHPKYGQAVSQIEEWRDTFTNAVRNVPQTVKASLDAAKAAELELEKALRAQETAALELDKLAIQYKALSREVDSDRAMFEAVLGQLKQTSVTKEAQPNKVRVVQQGYRPERPFSPKKLQIMALGFLGGIFAGILAALGLHSMDHSFKTVDQVEEVLQMPVLGAVPVMREVRTTKSQLIVSDDPKCAGSEAFRTLRTSLTMLGKAEERRVFLFTSAVPQEGKTFTSLNYSASLAQQGLRTLLIDCDLRKPSVEEYFGVAGARSVGVTDYLTGQKKFEEILQTSKLDKLLYISGGTTAPNPAELIAQGGFPGLLAEALRHFDRVIVDSAPIHAVSDTLLLVPHVQTVCVVARAARTPRKAIQRAIHLLRNAGAPLAGVVLNRLPRRRGPGYGYYYYSPYYDYSYYGKYSKKGVYGAK